MTREQLLERTTNEQGAAMVRLDWYARAWEALDDVGVLLLALWLPRQSGKSTWLAFETMCELLTVPGSYVLYLAAAESQAMAVFARKLRRVVERLVRSLGVDRRSLLVTKRSLENLEHRQQGRGRRHQRGHRARPKPCGG